MGQRRGGGDESHSYMKFLFWLVIGLISYGSLYPLDFVSGNPHHLTLVGFLLTSMRYSGNGDTLGNLLLFVPMTIFGRLAWPRTRASVLMLGALILAVGLQILQLWLPSRVPSLQDAMVNEIGAALGFLLVRIPDWMSTRWRLRVDDRARYPLLLLALWLGYRLMPFVPAIDWQSWKDSLKPLLLHPQLPWVQVLLAICSWTVVTALWDRLWSGRQARAALAVLILVSFAAEVVIVNNVLTATNVLGAIAGYFLWPLLRRGPSPGWVLGALLLLSFVLEELSPFRLRTHGIEFHWVPFWGFLHGSMYINVASFQQKLFIYGALIWLGTLGGLRLWMSVALVAAAIFVLVIAQSLFVGHTGDITGVLMALGMGWIKAVFDRNRIDRHSGTITAKGSRD